MTGLAVCGPDAALTGALSAAFGPISGAALAEIAALNAALAVLGPVANDFVLVAERGILPMAVDAMVIAGFDLNFVAMAMDVFR